MSSALFFFELAQICFGRIAMFERLAPLLLVMAVGVVGSVLFSVFSLVLLDRVAFPIGDPMDSEPVSIPGLVDELRDSGAASVLFWILLNSPRLFIIAQQKDADSVYGQPPADVASNPADPTSGPPEGSKLLVDLLSRLLRHIGTDIVAISAELHYLRVYTRNGEALIRMSFDHAVEALDMTPGQLIHRLHWVALTHVATLESDGNCVICRLDTGLALPVSRTHRSRLRAVLSMHDRELALRSAEKISAASAAAE